MTIKTPKELDKMRKRRGINKTTLSACCGANSSSWGEAVRRNNASSRFKRNVVRVLKFYDEKGYVPAPGEIELEQLGRLPSK